ncbi:unnamed protein product [Polarella glacialis]|uniref:Casein kinase I n=1 Tax=Polarella glacialis TaxID=89957 RepID=A0A813FHH8_POLGL|nr:unnamed protein product [Polarella glacialis]CAE8726161.1 unnamed protein product [Polarella glacialis]
MSAKTSYYSTYEEEEEEESEDDVAEDESESSEKPPTLPRVVAGQFCMQGEIGSGSYSEVYLGIDQLSGGQVAIKVEWEKAEKGDKLLGEAKYYEALGQTEHTPHIRWSGTEGEYNMMVMDLLGPSLDLLFKQGGRFSLKTVVMLAEQIIDRLEFVHERGILYRDIKPHNFLMGLGEHCSRVYIVDFGLAKNYRDEAGAHIPPSQKKRSGITGTVRYSSLNAHNGIDASRRDDLEATGYMLLHFLRGDLPWLGLKAKSKKTKHKLIGSKKTETSDAELCEGFPDEFVEFFRHCRAVEFAEKPDYAYLKGLMQKIAIREGFKCDKDFDWSNNEKWKSKISKKRVDFEKEKGKEKEGSRDPARRGGAGSGGPPTETKEAKEAKEARRKDPSPRRKEPKSRDRSRDRSRRSRSRAKTGSRSRRSEK